MLRFAKQLASLALVGVLLFTPEVKVQIHRHRHHHGVQTHSCHLNRAGRSRRARSSRKPGLRSNTSARAARDAANLKVQHTLRTSQLVNYSASVLDLNEASSRKDDQSFKKRGPRKHHRRFVLIGSRKIRLVTVPVERLTETVSNESISIVAAEPLPHVGSGPCHSLPRPREMLGHPSSLFDSAAA